MGRSKSEDPMVTKPVGMNAERWEWLDNQSKSRSAVLRDLVDAARGYVEPENKAKAPQDQKEGSAVASTPTDDAQILRDKFHGSQTNESNEAGSPGAEVEGTETPDDGSSETNTGEQEAPADPF